jgi:hypothetical protein
MKTSACLRDSDPNQQALVTRVESAMGCKPTTIKFLLNMKSIKRSSEDPEQFQFLELQKNK